MPTPKKQRLMLLSCVGKNHDLAVIILHQVHRYLPLYLSICGSIIRQYEGDTTWQTELPAELKKDRLGTIQDADDAHLSAHDVIIDASLTMVSTFVSAVFYALVSAFVYIDTSLTIHRIRACVPKT